MGSQASGEQEYTPVRRAMNGLSSTSASFLVSDSPLTSSAHLPPLQTSEISPNVNRFQSLLDTSASTEKERLLMAALEDRNMVISAQKIAISSLQAQTILHSAYVEDLRGRLEGKEEKNAKGKDRGRINTDGLPKILTQDMIFKAVHEAQELRNATKNAAVKRKDAKSRYTDSVSAWKIREADRKDRNDALKAEWAEDVRKWEVEKNRAKCERKKPRWTKPKMPTMEKAIIKPKVADFMEESGGEEDIDEDEDEGNDEEMGNSDCGDSD